MSKVRSEHLNTEWARYILQIDIDAFLDLQQLQHLYLDHNQLDRLSAGMLSGLPSLRRLDLQDNLIRYISLHVGWMYAAGASVVIELPSSAICCFPYAAPHATPYAAARHMVSSCRSIWCSPYAALRTLCRLTMLSKLPGSFLLHLQLSDVYNSDTENMESVAVLQRTAVYNSASVRSMISAAAFSGLTLKWLLLDYNRLSSIFADTFAGLNVTDRIGLTRCFLPQCS